MKFQYYETPKTLDECIQALKHYGTDGRILAGGTDVIPRLRQRLWHYNALIDVTNIPELLGLRYNAQGVSIGAAERLSQIQKAGQSLTGAYQVLCCGAGHVSSLQIRNAATLGGNLCNASPSADTVPALAVLHAVAQIKGSNCYRDLPVEEMLLGPGKTVLEPEEVLTRIFLPAPPAHTGTSYHKYSIRGDSDIAIVGAAASLTLDHRGIIQQARIALGGVAPTVYIAKEAESLLMGQPGCPELFLQAAESAGSGCSPITDQRATAGYRRQMATVWTRHALEDAWRFAKQDMESRQS